MLSKYINRDNFYSSFFEKNCVSNVCGKISLAHNDLTIPIETYTLNKNTKIHSFELVPDYLNLAPNENSAVSKVFQKTGYAINLIGYTNLESFTASQLKSSNRKNLNRSIKKLETCFNITYKIYFGNILISEYNSYMNALHQMLVERFFERNDRNMVLENWDYYLKSSYELISQKKASLLVVLSDKEPIGFSLNYHSKALLYSAIASYNLNYSKFSIGNIIIYKLIDWSVLNQIDILDMGFGDFSHKRLWCNMVYSFDNHIIYNKGNVLAIIYTFGKKAKFKLINYLIEKKVNTKFNDLKRFLKSKGKPTFVNHNSYNINEAEHEDSNQLVTLVDLDNNEYQFLKRASYDFLFSSNENVNDISVYKIDNKVKSYIIRGKNSSSKIIFH